jgi:hypothetical protein
MSSGGVSPSSAIIQLTAGQVVDYSPVLQAAAAIFGDVTVNGRSVGAGWYVELYRASDYPGEVYRVVRTDRNGSYRFAGIDAPESYVVQVRETAGGDPRGSRTVSLKASQQLRVKVRADP